MYLSYWSVPLQMTNIAQNVLEKSSYWAQIARARAQKCPMSALSEWLWAMMVHSSGSTHDKGNLSDNICSAESKWFRNQAQQPCDLMRLKCITEMPLELPLALAGKTMRNEIGCQFIISNSDRIIWKPSSQLSWVGNDSGQRARNTICGAGNSIDFR